MAERPGPGEGHWFLRQGPWIGFAASIGILLVMAWMRRHSLDDSFINYRIVRQIEAGNGPVFNAGERIEAYTSPGWLALLTLGDVLLPIRLEWIGMLGGIIIGAIGLVFAGMGSRLLQESDRLPSRSVLLIPLGALVVAVFPPIYRLIATGLEDGLTIAWLGGCVWVLGRWSRSNRPIGLPSAVLLGLGVLVRPDLAPFTMAFIVVILIADRDAGWRRNATMLGSLAAIPVLSEVLRMGYFGVLTPNTAIAKSAALARWGYGWNYLTDTFVPYWFWVPVATLIAIGYFPVLRRFRNPDATGHDRRSALVTAAFGAGSVVCAVYIVRVGGDYMETRLLLPTVFGILAPVTFVSWPRPSPIESAAPDRRTLPWPRLGAYAVTVVWIVVCGLFIRTPSDDRAVLFEARNAVTLADIQATFPGPIAPDVEPSDVFLLHERLPYRSARGRTPIVTELGVGKVGYALSNDVYLLDALGLANPIAAHEKLLIRGWPGHEKVLSPPWIAALSTAPGSDVDEAHFRPPEALGHVRFHRQDDPRGRPFAERVTTARAVLKCNRMRAFRKSYSAPLTAGRFFSNIAAAWGNQHLVIPGEPADAAQQLCTPQERSAIDWILERQRENR